MMIMFSINARPVISFALLVLVLLLPRPAAAEKSFSYESRGRKYTIKTVANTQNYVSFPPLQRHWLYKPSVTKVQQADGSFKWIMLFAANTQSGVGHIPVRNNSEAIFISESSNGVSFTQPTLLLNMATNLCDMAGAATVFDGSQWHIFTQAVMRTSSNSDCGTTLLNARIFEAVGGNQYGLRDQFGQSLVSWRGGNESATPLISSIGGSATAGIGEAQQWFRAEPHSSGRLNGFVNDWALPAGGNQLFFSLSHLDNTIFQEQGFDVANSNVPGAEYELATPDVILNGSFDEAILGKPALGFQSSCEQQSDAIERPHGVGFYPSLPPSDPSDARYFVGELESGTGRMFRPRFARNPYGTLDLDPSSTPTRKVWKTFIYYNDQKVRTICGAGVDPFPKPGNQNPAYHRFAVSEIEIWEEAIPAPPAITEMSPAIGIGVDQVFRVVAGGTGLTKINLLINKVLDGNNSCFLAYVTNDRLIVLVEDNGADAKIMSIDDPDLNKTISNSRCIVRRSGSQVSWVGGQLTLDLNMSFTAAHVGGHAAYAYATAGAVYSSWKVFGAWTVPSTTTYPRVEGQVEPAIGSGSGNTFSVTYRDQTSGQNFGAQWLLINSTLDGAAACYVSYYQGYIYLTDDAGPPNSQYALVSAGGVLQNSQCSISVGGVQSTIVGQDATLSVPITFKSPAFSGTKIVYAAAQVLATGQTTSWQASGLWFVP